MVSKIVNWWMALEPSTQYMYWVITFCAMLTTGTAGLLVLSELGILANVSLGLIAMVGGLIGGFIALFMFVVLFFAIFYPMIRKDKDTEQQ